MAYISSLPQMQQTDQNGNPITQTSQQGLLPNTGGSLPIPQGVDKSFVEGYLAMQKNSRDNDETAMASSLTHMKEEAFGWARDDREKKLAIDQGMVTAARAGGYGAVIDFLRQNDPDRALAFEQEKGKLDASIMENQTYALAHQDDKAKVMLQGYSLLGGIGATLMNMPANQREAAYAQLAPIAKQIAPDMPDTLDGNAIAKLGLGMALSTPANILYDKSKQIQQAQSAGGRLQADIDARQARGETIDNSEGLRSLYVQRAKLENDAIKSQQEVEGIKYDQQQKEIQAATNVLDMQNKQQQLIGSITKNYNERSKDFAEFQTNNSKVWAAIDILAKDPTNPAAQKVLQFAFAKANAGGGAMSDQDVTMLANSDGNLAQILKKMKSIGFGNSEALTANEIQNMKVMYAAIADVYDKRQSATNRFYKTQLEKYGLQGNLQFYESAPQDAIQYLQAHPTDQNKKYFEETYGYKPDMSAMGTQ